MKRPPVVDDRDVERMIDFIFGRSINTNITSEERADAAYQVALGIAKIQSGHSPPCVLRFVLPVSGSMARETALGGRRDLAGDERFTVDSESRYRLKEFSRRKPGNFEIVAHL